MSSLQITLVIKVVLKLFLNSLQISKLDGQKLNDLFKETVFVADQRSQLER